MKIKEIKGITILSNTADIVILASKGEDVDVLHNLYVKDSTGKMIHVHDYYLQKYGF